MFLEQPALGGVLVVAPVQHLALRERRIAGGGSRGRLGGLAARNRDAIEKVKREGLAAVGPVGLDGIPLRRAGSPATLERAERGSPALLRVRCGLQGGGGDDALFVS